MARKKYRAPGTSPYRAARTRFALVAALALALAFTFTACDTGPGEEAAAPAAGELTRVTGVAYRPAEGAMIYLYRPGDDLRGPPFNRIGPLGPDADYSIELPPGDYFFVLRHRSGDAESGPVVEGDLKTDPVKVTVEAGKPLQFNLLGFIKSGNAKESFGESAKWSTVLTGHVTDPEGKPVEGVRVQIYDHVQMSERPKYVSGSTGPDGKWEIELPEGGTYYLVARNRYGGPPKVGDLYGRYDKGTVEPSAVIVGDNERIEGVDIVVHTVW